MDALIDAFTRDYALPAGKGQELKRDPAAGLLGAAYRRLATPLGSWWAEPTVGSRLHTLARSKDLARVAILARQYALQALQPLINDGRATAIDVVVERPRTGWLAMQVTITAANGQEFSFAHPVKVA